MTTSRLLFLCFVVFFCLSGATAQLLSAGAGDPPESYTVKHYEESPTMRADISKLARLKIFLRKANYHVDEIMFLDVAMLANAKSPHYFPTELDIKVKVTNRDSGKSIVVRGLYSIDFARPSFVKTKDALIVKTFRIIVGCANTELGVSNEILNSSENKVLFDNNIFRTLPEGCIDIDRAGQLEISAELTNAKVAIPLDGSLPTAVGTIRSNSININVRK